MIKDIKTSLKSRRVRYGAMSMSILSSILLLEPQIMVGLRMILSPDNALIAKNIFAVIITLAGGTGLVQASVRPEASIPLDER